MTAFHPMASFRVGYQARPSPKPGEVYLCYPGPKVVQVSMNALTASPFASPVKTGAQQHDRLRRSSEGNNPLPCSSNDPTR